MTDISYKGISRQYIVMVCPRRYAGCVEISIEDLMETKQWLIRSGLALSILGAAGLMTALPAAAQTQRPSTPSTTNEPAKSSTMKPSRGDDDAAEFTKLDKNKDGYLDKAEATMEPKLLGKWADVDTNKDGKISREEFLAFERKEHTAKK
jgi:hypothetical protein